MEKLQNLTNQEKVQLMHHLGKMYRKGRLQTVMALQGMVEECDKDDADMEIASRIRLILRRMDQRHALILLNDFFEIKERGWWKERYSHTTYYRCKKDAVNLLLAQLYTETA